MSIRVYKFGGSCLTTPASLERVRALIERGGGPPVVCVFSALQGVTDKLLEMSRRALLGEVDTTPLLAEHAAYLKSVSPERRREAEARLNVLAEELRRTLLGIGYLQEVSPRVKDRVASFGERAAVVLAEALLADAGLPVEGCPDGDPGFVTDGTYGDGRILQKSADVIRQRFGHARERVSVVPGFVGKDEKGNVTTLGRGGSDYTATFIGATLGCDTTLFKDVEGLLTSDPKIVADARPIERLHYLDALELAHYGLKAIAEKAILPALRGGTRIEIRGFLNPSLVSVIEGGEADVLAITCVRRAIMVDFVGEDMLRTLAGIFHMFADTQTFPLLVTEASPRGETSIVLKENDYGYLAAHLAGERLETPPKVTEDLGVVAVIGSHMRGRVGFAASIFQCLAAHSINIVAIAQTASERNVSVIVGREVVEEAVRALHARFIGGRGGAGGSGAGGGGARAAAPGGTAAEGRAEGVRSGGGSP